MNELIALKRRLRPPMVDGLFYPEDAAGVLAYMQSIGLKQGGGGGVAEGGIAEGGIAARRARAIVAPHGAWEVSGSLAGAAFASAAGRAGGESPSRVVIMGPIHDDCTEGIFLTNSYSFQTPLGEIPVDVEACGWIESYSPFLKVDDIPHLHEHSIEVLLPFVKYCFPQAAIVPILMGRPCEQHIATLAHALRAVFEPVMDSTLLAVSFNLSMHPGEEAALEMADECIRLFREGSFGELCAALKSGRIASCGGGLLAALLQSGLVDSARPRVASDLLLHALNEDKKTVYYSAFSFE